MRKIIHIDQDCFYAAVEIRDNPSLKGKPVAVGGPAEGRGVLTTASYEARKFGVRSAMPTSQALRLCPNLIVIPVDFDKYRVESRKIREIFREFTDKIEPLSLDEAYLDVSECTQFDRSATKIASEIRRRIFQRTQLTASAGIASNKFLAKVASDWNKPNGQFTITPKMVESFIRQLRVEKIPGVGTVTAKKMHGLGMRTCKDMQKWEIQDLHHTFGVWGLRLYALCRGLDDRPVVNQREPKSLSVESTYARDLMTVQECLEKVPELYEEFDRRLTKAALRDKIHALVVKVKFHDFKQTTLERTELKDPSPEVYASMIQDAYQRGAKPVRLLGLGVRLRTQNKPQQPTLQMTLF